RSLLSGINTKHLFKIFTIKVKTVSNLHLLTTDSKVYRGGGTVLLSLLRVTERGAIYGRETN
ncbi:hypothetical protein ACP0G5_27690, partial [Escherichia coli]|uniref:hypothetical protein n=1 Tax=Escherichia coli TaxID=562 RepID=UPI003CF9478C